MQVWQRNAAQKLISKINPNALQCQFNIWKLHLQLKFRLRIKSNGSMFLDSKSLFYVHCAMYCTVWVKKIPPPEGSWHFSFFFTNYWEFLINFLHTYYTFLSTLDYKFLFKYPRFWRSYAILSATTQFTQYAQNVHHRLKRMRWHVCVSRW